MKRGNDANYGRWTLIIPRAPMQFSPSPGRRWGATTSPAKLLNGHAAGILSQPDGGGSPAEPFQRGPARAGYFDSIYGGRRRRAESRIIPPPARAGR